MKKLLMIGAAAVAVAMVLPAVARDAKYAAPYWTMGHYDVGSPQSFTAVVTNAPTLAFKNMTLAELKTKLDGGYSILGQTIGKFMATARKLGQFYNVQYYPASGTPTMIAGDFATTDNSNVKAVDVKFTEIEGDIYAEFIGRNYIEKSTDLTYKFITVDENGDFSWAGKYQEYNYAAEWNTDGYGVAAVQLAQFLPSGSPALVFADATLDDLADVFFTASIGGKAADKGYRCIEYSRTATESAIDVTLKQTDGNISVTVRLTEGTGGVYAQAVSAANGASALALAGSFADAGLCVWGLTALEPAYETAARTTYTAASQNTVPNGSSILVWSGATLDHIKDFWLSCNFKEAMSNAGIKGRGCNRTITYDAEGAAAKIRIQFQTRDKNKKKASDDYIKTVIVDMTNGVDGVYATKISATHVSPSSYTVGYNASESGTDSYMVYNLTATPCVTLEADEDWTGYSSLDCGDAVIDLNGHELAVLGIECVNAAIGKVVNTKTATMATLLIDVPSGDTYTNDKVDIGYSSAGYSTPLTYSCLATDNIRVVKDGPGVYVAQAKSEYSGGTDVDAGTLKPGVNSAGVFGAAGTTLAVADGAQILDTLAANSAFANHYLQLEGDGPDGTGAYRVTVRKSYAYNYGWTRGLTLTGDTLFGRDDYGFGLIRDSNYAELPLTLNNHTLTFRSPVKATEQNATHLAISSVKSIGPGTLVISDYVKLYPKSGVESVLSEVTLVIEPLAEYWTGNDAVGMDLTVSNLVYRSSSAHSQTAHTTTVYGCYKPESTASAPKVKLGDASHLSPTLDLSSCTGTFDTAFGGGLAFTEGSAVSVRMGGRNVPKKVIGWAEGTGPSNVTFVLADADEKLEVRSDGVYCRRGFMLIVK